MSGKRDSDPRPLVWETNALPTELFPLVCQSFPGWNKYSYYLQKSTKRKAT